MTTPELQEAEARVREAMTKPYYAMTYEANTAAWVLARAWLAAERGILGIP